MLCKLFKDHYHHLDPYHYLDAWKFARRSWQENINEDRDKILQEIFGRFQGSWTEELGSK